MVLCHVRVALLPCDTLTMWVWVCPLAIERLASKAGLRRLEQLAGRWGGRKDRQGEHDVSDRSVQVVHSDLPWSNRVVLDAGMTVSTAREDRRKKGG